MKRLFVSSALSALLLPLPACHSTGAQAKPPPAASLGFDAADFDRSVEPAADFFQFANGGWVERHPIPPEYPAWNVFTELDQRVQEQVRSVLEEAQRSSARPGTNQQKIGDFYCSCMDEARIRAAGASPLAPLYAAIEAAPAVGALAPVLARLHAEGINALFYFFAEQDPADATRYVTWLYQGGLGLPDRDYYTRTDADSLKLLTQYREHVQRMFALSGEPEAAAAARAQTVLQIESELAQGSMTNVEQRDPKAIYHLMSLQQARTLWPSWPLSEYLAGIGYPKLAELNVCQPRFVETIERLLSSRPLSEWKTYLRWQVLDQMAPVLSEAFEQEDFAFKGRILSGTEAQKPRWKRCVQFANQALGEAVGEVYVERHFSPTAKAKANAMVQNLVAAFRERLLTRDWMSQKTRVEARKKLDAIAVKIGYPDKWRDYSKLSVSRDSFAANILAAGTYNFRRNMDKLGKPIDRGEWGMPPQTVNASYNPSMNDITFPAGILQEPFFYERQDDALNYGAMGAVIGHELTHGFDDQGSQYDAQGNLRMWWTPEDRAEFERRAKLISQQYAAYNPIDDLHVNGDLTLGENIADLGGVTIALHALQMTLRGKPRPEPVQGFSVEQRFFLAWARAWRNNTRPESLRLAVNTNPHSPGRFRATGPLVNVPEFAKSFPSTGEKSDSPPVAIW